MADHDRPPFYESAGAHCPHAREGLQERAQVEALADVVATLVASLPRCDACDAPATHAWRRGEGRWCSAHALPGCPPYPRAAPLEALQSLLAHRPPPPSVRVPEAEFLRLLADLAHLRRQRDDLQAYAGRLLEGRTRPAEAALAELRAAVREQREAQKAWNKAYSGDDDPHADVGAFERLLAAEKALRALVAEPPPEEALCEPCGAAEGDQRDTLPTEPR
jgi:hypothetical protein